MRQIFRTLCLLTSLFVFALPGTAFADLSVHLFDKHFGIGFHTYDDDYPVTIHHYHHYRRPHYRPIDYRPRHYHPYRYGVHWARYRGYLPVHAIVGGDEPGRELVICQAHYHGGMHPGKVIGDRCNITYGGREILRDNFRILVGNSVRWVSKYGRIGDAVIGGREDGHPLYVCRARYRGGIHPGKVVGRNCNIGYDGREIVRRNYEVLIYA